MLSGTTAVAVRAAEKRDAPAAPRTGGSVRNRSPLASDKAQCGPSPVRAFFPKERTAVILPSPSWRTALLSKEYRFILEFFLAEPPGSCYGHRECVRQQRDALVERLGPWTAHCIHLGDNVYTFTEPHFDSRLRRFTQIAADIVGRPVRQHSCSRPCLSEAHMESSSHYMERM